MVKRIVICCDGTWNSPDASEAGVPCSTNVAKVAHAVLPEHEGRRQLTYYNSGVGALGSWLYRAVAGATGLGLSANLLDAYSFLVRTYQPGDELFLFGFSRGAFTVRSLAGLINNSGVLLPKHAVLSDRAFDIYRSRKAASHPRREEATLFRKSYAHLDRTPIRFIGVWDTVGALGNPLLLMQSPLSRRYRFHDTGLSSTVENAFHALAIDEKRRHFKAALWHRQPGSRNQHVEQRWFVGVHANVGGGYASTGLSDIALRWMAAKALECGLGLDDAKLPGAAGSADEPVAPEESRTGLYKLIPTYHRPIDSEANRITQTMEGMKNWETHEAIDDSVCEFMETDPNYRPPELVRYLRRNRGRCTPPTAAEARRGQARRPASAAGDEEI